MGRRNYADISRVWPSESIHSQVIRPSHIYDESRTRLGNMASGPQCHNKSSHSAAPRHSYLLKLHVLI